MSPTNTGMESMPFWVIYLGYEDDFLSVRASKSSVQIALHESRSVTVLDLAESCIKAESRSMFYLTKCLSSEERLWIGKAHITSN